MQSDHQQMQELQQKVFHLAEQNHTLIQNYIKAETKLAHIVAYSKVRMFEADQLVDAPCLFCQVRPDQVTAQQKSALTKQYEYELIYQGFHCEE